MFSIFAASKLINQSITTNLKLINMRTDYELVEALKAMYIFLGGDYCMNGSGKGSKAHHFRCGVSADNNTLINAIAKAATGQGKRVVCEYSGGIANIEVIF